MVGFLRQTQVRRAIALVAAYAFAIQTMLLAVVGVERALAQSASTDFSVICFGNGAPGSHDSGPVKRLHDAPCVLCGFVLAAAPDVPSSAAAPAFRAASRVAYALALALAPAASLHTPRLSQGPPAIA